MESFYDEIETWKLLRQGEMRPAGPVLREYRGWDTRKDAWVDIKVNGYLMNIEDSDADRAGVDSYITLLAYEESKKNLEHEGLTVQVRALLAEYAFEEWLEKMKLEFKWAKRQRGYWDENEERQKKFDFMVNGHTIDIVSVAPQGNMIYCAVPIKQWKQSSDYIVCVKMLDTKCIFNYNKEWYKYVGEKNRIDEYTEPHTDKIPKRKLKAYTVGDALICGYETTEGVKNWDISNEGHPCDADHPCYCQRIDRLKPIDGLLDILKSPKTKRESPA